MSPIRLPVRHEREGYELAAARLESMPKTWRSCRASFSGMFRFNGYAVPLSRQIGWWLWTLPLTTRRSSIVPRTPRVGCREKEGLLWYLLVQPFLVALAAYAVSAETELIIIAR